MNDRAVLREFGLGMADGALRQARSPVRQQGQVGTKAPRVQTLLEWKLSWAQVCVGWLIFAAERS